MRLQQYINESEFLDNKVMEYIKNNCKPFLKEFGKSYVNEKFIYRGLKTKNLKTYSLIKSRKNREPRFINKELHKYLDELSKKYFGWKVRSEGVFTGSKTIAINYGNTGIFIPSGNYKYVYINDVYKIYPSYDSYNFATNAAEDWEKSRIRDFWKEREDEVKKLDKETKEKLEYHKNKITKIYKIEYKTSGLSSILKGDTFEAIFQCKEYIIIPIEKYKLLSKFIGELI